MWLRISVLAAVLLSLTGVAALTVPKVLEQESAIAQSQTGEREGQRPPKGDRDGWLQDLNLSPEQMKQMQEIRGRYKDQLAQKKQAMRQARQELRSLMASNAPTEQVRQKYNQVKTLRQNHADAQFESMLAMREILTLEQRQKLAEKMDRQHGKGRDRRERREDRMEQGR